MTTTNPNPLDRIRSLAPAKMTDDELGVACYLYGVGEPVPASPGSRTVGWPSQDSGPNSDVDISLDEPLEGWPIWIPLCTANPALSYDALLPIVREWWEIRLGEELSYDDYQVIFDEGPIQVDDELSLTIDIDATPRQLAEAAAKALGEE